ncbi:AAA family ATPase [Syntrophus aciditrophicus]|nr:AAA family ATPase [Syntrophus aciditrophicus]OPY13976.1 MAG: Tyrosine-protein kinase YwqD [Syntrophus sp. PtaB.Bin075]
MSKLQKALEKAKEERESTLLELRQLLENPQDNEDRPALKLLDTPDRITQPADVDEKVDRVSPVYSQSRAVTLNPDVMERNRCVAMFPNQEEVEAYRVLRTQILNRTRETGGNLIMVTSALPGEGKTLTAINLALTFAREYKQTVLLVDCDLKKQNIHEVMGFESDKGLVDNLLGECSAGDLFVWPAVEKMTLISGGKTTGESSEMMGSPRMKNLVADMKHRYPERYIFFDVPPILTGADALAFAPLMDHILMVVQADKTPVGEVNKAAQLLPKEKLLGLVLNRYHA